MIRAADLARRCGALTILAASLGTTASAQTIAITGGRVLPVSGPAIDNGTVLIRDGKIAAVGANVTIPAGAQRIDATGRWVTPGLVNSATQLGLVEIGAVGATREMFARGRDGIAASFTVWEGLNPASVMLAPAREEGVTSVVVYPQGGLISGQAALLDLDTGSVGNLILKSPIAMIGQIGAAQQANTGARGELLVRLRELFDDVKAYSTRRSEYERAATRDFGASRSDLEALIPVVEGRLPLLLAVDKASDIEAALKIASDYKLKIIIGGGAESWMVAGKLAAAKVPVLTGAMNNIPGSFATLGQRQEAPALLRAAGVQVALVGNAGGGDEEAFNVRNIKAEAGNAVAYGMPWEEALRAVTLTPAEIFGVSDRIGSLREGREANVVIWNGDPFEFATRAEHVFVRGKEIKQKTRQDMLVERYKQLPVDYRKPPQ